MKRCVLNVLLLMMMAFLDTSAEEAMSAYIPVNSKLDVLLAPGMLRTQAKLRETPSGQATLYSDGVVYQLTDTVSILMMFAGDDNPDDLFWDVQGNFYFSTGKSLFRFDSNTEQSDEILTTQNEATFVGDLELFYFFEKQSKKLLKTVSANSTPLTIGEFEEPINVVKKTSGGCFVGFGNKIVAITDANKFIPIAEVTEPITAIDITDSGAIFYGTNSQLCFYDNFYNNLAVMKKGVEDLLVSDDNLYVVFTDHSVVRISNIAEFASISSSFNDYRTQNNITYQLRDDTNLLKDNTLLVKAGEINITEDQLCIIPGQGIFLLTGDAMISLESNEDVTRVIIPQNIFADRVIFTENDVIAKSDTTILSCKSTPEVLFKFDTNQFKIWPSTSNDLFITTKPNDNTVIYLSNVKNRSIHPYLTLPEDVVYIAGDTALCVIVTKQNIYSVNGQEATLLLRYSSPINSAALSARGIVFSTEDGILLLEAINEVGFVDKRKCQCILADQDRLYFFYDDGTLECSQIATIAQQD